MLTVATVVLLSTIGGLLLTITVLLWLLVNLGLGLGVSAITTICSGLSSGGSSDHCSGSSLVFEHGTLHHHLAALTLATSSSDNNQDDEEGEESPEYSGTPSVPPIISVITASVAGVVTIGAADVGAA